jgi:peptidoglycan/LPS O-acetylase OafA/YrhL
MKNKYADGLRGIAAFNVAVAHFVAAFLPMMLHKNYPTIFSENPNPSQLFEILTSPIISIFYNGHFAVLIFFVLSGYVLTLPFFSNNSDSTILLQKRLWGRYLRLNIPIAIAILISYFVYKLGLYSNIQAAEMSGSVKWLNNFFPVGITALNTAKEAAYGGIFFGSGTLVPPLWTLKIEFIGSLYILLFYISKPQRAVFAPLLMVCCLIYAIHLQDSIYYFAIFAGSLLNNSKSISKYRFIIFALGLYFGGFQFNSVVYDYLPNLNFLGFDIWERKTFYNAIGAVLVTLSVLQGFGSKVFQSRLFQFLGRISYSIYLIHFIVLCSLSSFVYVHLPQSKLFVGINFVMYVVVCFGVSMIFEEIVDKGAISISHKFSSKIFSQ